MLPWAVPARPLAAHLAAVRGLAETMGWPPDRPHRPRHPHHPHHPRDLVNFLRGARVERLVAATDVLRAMTVGLNNFPSTHTLIHRHHALRGAGRGGALDFAA